MHTNSRLIFEKYAKEYFLDNFQVLEIGPDKFPSTYCQSVGNSSIQWDTIDLYKSDKLTYRSISEYEFPIESNQYDIVLSGQVIEHVRKPWVWIKELERVCKKGGLVITVNPVSWVYHEAPIDCWRIYPEGMKAIYEEANLEILLSKWETLENPKHKNKLAGRSLDSRAVTKNYVRIVKILSFFGFPIESSFDTITIGKK